jgi:hypothetical protein
MYAARFDDPIAHTSALAGLIGGELNKDGEASALIWWYEKPTKPDFVDFWPVLDAWIGIFFEDADHN